MTSPVSILLLDDGHQTFDGLAAAVALFGRGRVELAYLDDAHSLRVVAQHTGVQLLLVDVDGAADPKSVLADLIDAVGLPIVVLTDGRPAVVDGVRAVDALAWLPTALPARELVELLTALAASLAARPGEGTNRCRKAIAILPPAEVERQDRRRSSRRMVSGVASA